MDAHEQHHLIQLSKGDKGGLASLHEMYSPKVFHYCLQFVRNQEVAQEITLDVFLQVWKKRSIIQTNRPLGALLFKITKDYSISYLRKVAKSGALRKEFIESYVLSLESPVEKELFLNEGLKIAREAIDGLPPRCKEVFQLRYHEDFSLRQIAQELDISQSTVKKHLQKGKQIVKTYLSANADLIYFLFIGQCIL